MSNDNLATSILEQERALRRERIWAEAVAKVWHGDVAFADELRADPKGVLQRMGADFPSDMNVEVLENTPTNMTFVLPIKPRLIETSSKDAVFLYAACPCTVCATSG